MEEKMRKIFEPPQKVQKMYEAIAAFVEENRDLSAIKVSVKDIVSQGKEAGKIKPMLNLNQVILGGSGTGKSRFL